MNEIVKKSYQKFYCNKCDYSCVKKTHWIQHINTIKHKSNKMLTNANQKKSQINKCKYCDKVYKHISSLCRHQNVCSILSRTNSMKSKCFQNVSNKYICKCGRKYKSRSGLYKHSLKCCFLEDEDIKIKKTVDNFNIKNVEELLKNILEENKELKEQMKNIKMSNITNNNNNQKYTINMYLNDKCKNAMSLKEFVDNIKLSLKDLEFTSHHGFVEGVSNIFLKNLNDMEVTERPIHCSDQKRLQFYVKKEDKWEKDKQNEEIDKSIQNISNKQIGTLIEWTKANPGYENNPDKMEEYFKIVGKTMGVDCEKNIRKIKKIISENVKLDV